ncbi:MAG: hypothetical protein V4590_06550 [Bacteroidota bacterium]
MKPQNEEFEEAPALLEEFEYRFKAYVKTLYELYLLKAVKKVSSGATTVLVIAIVILFASLLIVFASVGAALWLNHLLDNSFYGFFIVSGFYALLVAIIYALRKNRIRKTIQDIIICEMLGD